MDMVIEEATILEQPQIEALRRAYFDARGQEVQRRDENVRWYVARVGERVVGCYSAMDDSAMRQRWGCDFYRVPGRLGTRAIAEMQWHITSCADRDGYGVGFAVDPSNVPMLRAAERRGFVPVGVLFYRHPLEVPCRLQ